MLHPEIAAERLEALGDTKFAGAASAALAGALSVRLAEAPQVDAAGLMAALQRDGHGEAAAAVLRKLERNGLGTLAQCDAERAASVWDDAAHLRLRSGTLSNERQAAALALGRETSDFHLSRLRDIQEQDQRNLRPANRDEAEDAVIVHPFKRR
jgi:DNA primase